MTYFALYFVDGSLEDKESTVRRTLRVFFIIFLKKQTTHKTETLLLGL